MTSYRVDSPTAVSTERKTGMTSSNQWKKFEALVARIEKAAAPRDAVVKSPDRVQDITSGQLREVDASIRYKVGSADILITIECRKRRRKADQTWIEQLASKQASIGAARTIAVSSTGFTKPALDAATKYGIEARTLSEVTPRTIESWFMPGGAVHVARLIEDIRCFVVLYDEARKPWTHGFFAPVEQLPFKHKGEESAFKISAYLPVLERVHPELFTDIPLDGTRIELELPIEWQPGELLIGRDWELSVYLTKLIVTASYQSTILNIESGEHHEYIAPDGTTYQHSSFESNWLGESVRFDHQSDPSGTQHVSMEFLEPNEDTQD